MKIFNSNIRKLSLSIALVGMVMIGQSAWACVNPDKDGNYSQKCADAESGIFLVNDTGRNYDDRFVDGSGNLVVKNSSSFQGAHAFNEGRAIIIKSGNGLFDFKYAVIDTTGKIITPYYNDVGDLPTNGGVFRGFKEGLLAIQKENKGKWGFIDREGKEVIPLIYDDQPYLGFYRFDNGISRIKLNGKVGFIDKTGKVIVEPQYDGTGIFSGGMARVKKDGKYGFIDKTGKIVFPIIYSETDKSEWGNWITFGAKRDSKDVVLAKSGVEYDSVGSLKENRIWVKKNSLYGYIDDNAKEVIPLIYQEANNFSNGLARVKKDGKYGFIDMAGKVAINFQFDDAYDFSNNQVQATFGDDGKTPKWFTVDKTGKILTTRTSLADFRKKLEQGDDVYYKTADDSGKGMIFEIKGNLVQVQTKESQCSQRDYKGNCQNYIENQVGKWVKKSEVYPTNHVD